MGNGEAGRDDQKQWFVDQLVKTKRKGIEELIPKLEQIGFFDAPASTRFHSAYRGGLLKHSNSVCVQAHFIRNAEIAVRPDIRKLVPSDSVTIVSLLHDVCKADVYRQVEKYRKDKDGQWEKYTAYESDFSKMPLGHGEKSVIRLLRMGLELTTDEIIAIRWHMGAWDLSEYGDARRSFDAACDKCPLLPILMAADGLAARVSETRVEE